MKLRVARRGIPSKKRLIPWLLLLLALLSAANIIVYLGRNKMDTFVPATYKELYFPTEVPVLRGTKIVRQGVLSLEIAMKEPATGWTVSDDSGERSEQDGKYPALKLKDFIHDYKLEARGVKAPVHISTRFGFYSKEFYKKAGRTQPDNYWLISASIPVGKFYRRPLSYWVDTFPYVDDLEKEEAHLILREQMGITGGESQLEKIDKICAYLAALYKTGAGTPDDQMKVETSPLNILNRVRAGDGKIWCTQMAMIYHFFANVADIPTRLLTLEGHIDKTITTGHSFAESFLADRGCWVRVDPSATKFYVWNRENRLLNSADILHAALNGSFSDLQARTLKDGAVVTVPYADVNASDLQLFSPGAHLIYRRGSYAADGRIARYLFSPNLGYSLDAEYAKNLYLLRRILFGAWVVLLACVIAALASWINRASRKTR